MTKKDAFTLLELVIVIIIIGVMSSLALPKLFAVIEYSRVSEALTTMVSIRTAIERCYLMHDGSFASCDSGDAIGMEDPGNVPGAHFDYRISTNAAEYAVFAFRNATDGGDNLALYEPWVLESEAYAVVEVDPPESSTYNMVAYAQCASGVVQCGDGPYKQLGSCADLCFSVPSAPQTTF